MRENSLFNYIAGSLFTSLRGYYLVIACILALVILGGAFSAQVYLSRAETRSRNNIEIRNEVIEYSQKIRNAIWLAEDVQQTFLLTPLPKYQLTLNAYFESALRNSSILKKAPWILTAGMKNDISQLHDNIKTLKQASAELAEIRTHVDRLFPTTPVLREVMSADNQVFFTAASLGLNEVSYTGVEPSQREIHEIFEACQLEWLRMISNFRLYLLNLSGIFGNPESSLQVYTNNIIIQYQQIQHLLTMLDEKEQEGELGLQGTQSLIEMKQSAQEWWATYEKIKNAHKLGEWRADIPFIKTKITPLYDKIWQQLQQLDQHLEVSFSEDLGSLTHVARSSTYTLWGLVVLLLLVIIAGYYYLQCKILQPISTVAHALRSESWDSETWAQDVKKMQCAQLDETRDLILAFTNTSQKIRDRQRQLEYQATHDALTALPNRIHLKHHLEKEIARVSPRKLSIGLLLLDLDRFKEINDTLGHQLGDKVLQEVSARLLTCLRKTDFIARLGGDEFALLLSGITLNYAEEIAQRVVQLLQAPLEIDNFQLRIGGSIGIALYPLHGNDPNTLIRCADVAMYDSKQRACGYMIYDSSHDPNSISRLALISDFHEALEKNKLELYYQPKIDVQSGRVIGFEALLRWQHPEHGFIPPDELIPLAEKTGMIKELTCWVLKTAMQQCAHWLKNGYEFSIAVNLSVWDLLNPQLADYIRELFEKYAISSQHLLLEITESAMMADPEHAIETLNQLAAMNIKLAVDDFGTGFSSLSYLKKMPIDELKIDKSFVIDMCNNEHDAVLVRSTIDLSHNLGLSVVAEGVEDQEIWDLLEILRCDKLQGYFISRPMAVEQVDEWLDNWEAYPALTRHRLKQA